MQGRIPVRVVLDCFGLDLDSILCPCCGEAIETIDHCMVLRNRVEKSWHNIFKWWDKGDFNLLCIGDIIDHEGYSYSYFDKNQKLVWQAVLWSTMYVIWNIRNKVVFENSTMSYRSIVDEVQIFSYF